MSRLFTRRKVLETACWAGVSASVLPNVAFAQAPTNRRLVFVLLRGAMDGLHAIVPTGDPAYRATRGALAYERSAVSQLDSFFSIAPGLEALMPDYRRGELLAIQGVAIPYRTRSHFDAQSILETGLDRPIGSASGWLNRSIEALNGSNGFGLAVGGGLPKSMSGPRPVSTWSPGKDRLGSSTFEDSLARLYFQDPFLADAYIAAQTLKGQAMAQGMDNARGGLRQFKQMFQATANFLASDQGPRIAAMEFSGWDTHAQQGMAGGTLDRRLGGLANGLLALKAGLPGSVWRNTVVVVATEFGRTAAANGNRGTDHGTAGAMLVYGGNVNGGRVLTDWPGLAQNQLFEGRDLRSTLDTRQVLKGLLAEQFDITPTVLTREVFPNSASLRSLTGLVKSS